MTDQEYWDFLEDEAERYFKYIGLDPSKLQSYGSYKDLPSVLKRGNNTSDSSDENPASSTESNANSNKVENKVEKKEKVTEQDQYKKEMEKRAPATIEERMTQVFTPSMMGLVPGKGENHEKGRRTGLGDFEGRGEGDKDKGGGD
ncbi:hypothetical protein GUITHDRAFT_155068 [Guillardia theta CCMP2712]|uniref:Uncharacterized protein n=1 Tax=Guillardia theta (strain CCMP2712) TaxID=905079 RepID=L1ILC9_GUITC|nr:hypothetical protein GUITHDRAFT_155068 [Guillardia theta CCMP2712]EKX37063.1 hypothetical protein GUITHDRAFT_155068 [Guillardia theta CCMP2712]|eukprot:XP_005824043.1 hypothetical protein GUITHDRAFT_155068 [Guillardia theta CCMP2712]